MNHQDPLQRAAAEFSKWRANKTSRGGITPIALRQQAVALTEHYSVCKVVSTLGLSGSVIKRWREQLFFDAERIENTSHAFVELPQAVAPNMHIQQATLIFGEGSSLQVAGGLSTQLLTLIAKAVTPDNAGYP